MNLSAALIILTKAGYVCPTSEHYQTEREMVSEAITAAVSCVDPITVELAMKWAGLPLQDNGPMRFCAALGYLLGVMQKDAGTPIAESEPS